MEDSTLDDRLRQLLEELSGKLCEVIAESPEVSEKLDRIRSSGYSLYLRLDCKPQRGASLPLPTDEPCREEVEGQVDAGPYDSSASHRHSASKESSADNEPSASQESSRSQEHPRATPIRQLPARLPNKSESVESQPEQTMAAFRLNASDVAFFRSLGIDPTRRCRKPRRNSSSDG